MLYVPHYSVSSPCDSEAHFTAVDRHLKLIYAVILMLAFACLPLRIHKPRYLKKQPRFRPRDGVT